MENDTVKDENKDDEEEEEEIIIIKSNPKTNVDEPKKIEASATPSIDIVNDIQKKLDEKALECEKLQSQIEELEVRVNYLTEREEENSAENEQLQTTKDELETKVTAYEKEVKILTTEKKLLTENLGKKITTLESEKKELSENNSSLNKQIEKLKSLESDNKQKDEECNMMKKQLTKLNELEKEKETLLETQQSTQKQLDQFRTSEKDNQQMKESIKQLNQQLQEMNIIKEENHKVVQQIQKIQIKLKEKESLYQELQMKYDRLLTENKKLQLTQQHTTNKENNNNNNNNNNDNNSNVSESIKDNKEDNIHVHVDQEVNSRRCYDQDEFHDLHDDNNTNQNTSPNNVSPTKREYDNNDYNNEDNVVDKEIYITLLKQYHTLLSEAENLRKAFNSNMNQLSHSNTTTYTNTNVIDNSMNRKSKSKQKATNTTSSSSSSSNNNSNSDVLNSEAIGDYVKLFGDDIHNSTVLQSIKGDIIVTRLVQLFLIRYKTRYQRILTSITQPYDILARILKTYARGTDARITRTDLKDAFTDIGIDLSYEQMTIILDHMPENLDGDESENILTAQKVLNFLLDETVTVLRKSNIPLPPGLIPRKNITTTSVSKNNDGNTDKPAVKVSEQLKASPYGLPLDSKATSKRPGGLDKNRPVTAGGAGYKNNNRKIISTSDSSNMDRNVNQNKGPETNDATNCNDLTLDDLDAILSPKPSKSKMVKNPQPTTPTVTTNNDSNASSSSSGNVKGRGDNKDPLTSSPKNEEDVDWSAVPLPHNWERRTDPTTNKTYYVDHTNKVTQWKHPLASKSTSKKANSSSSSSSQ